MPIITLSPGQLSTLTGKNAVTLRGERMRELSAAAFGAAEPLLSRPLLMDAVAVMLLERLHTRGVSRKIAALIVRVEWLKWMEAVANIEHPEPGHDGEHWVFVACQLDKKIMGDFNWVALSGPINQLSKFVEDAQASGKLQRIFIVDVTEIIKTIRQRAEAALIDLSLGSFFLPPDHPLYIEWKAEFTEYRKQLQIKADDLRAPKIDKATFAKIESETARARQ